MKPQVLYTIGYQGVTLRQIIADLLENNVRKLIDVRCNAVSRIHGFSKGELKRACEGADIEYIHVPELGIPSEMRRNTKTNWQHIKLLDTYEKTMLPEKEAILTEIKEIVESEICALLCFEADYRMCHRGRLANKLEEISHLRVSHLEPLWDLAST